MADIDLKLDEKNQLAFTVDISGTEKAMISNPPKIRFVCEGEDKVSYSFVGTYTGNNQVKVEIPCMDKRMSEGVYKSHLEVIVEGKYFEPLSLDVEFTRPTQVVAEHIKKEEEVFPKKQVQASFVSSKTTKAPVRKTPAVQKQKKAPARTTTSLADQFKK